MFVHSIEVEFIAINDWHGVACINEFKTSTHFARKKSTRTACNHKFHERCLQQAMRMRPTCPICRVRRKDKNDEDEDYNDDYNAEFSYLYDLN